ncbi:MAG: hypothetical protein AAGI69_18345 [Cyanobacteria bacterium P01_H01_bin.21]
MRSSVIPLAVTPISNAIENHLVRGVWGSQVPTNKGVSGGQALSDPFAFPAFRSEEGKLIL